MRKFTKREIAALTYAVLAAVGAYQYCADVINGFTAPTPLTWILLFIAVCLGLWTYMRAGKSTHNFVTNVGNAVDVLVVGVILCVILIYRGNVLLIEFNQFDILCGIIAASIVAYYCVTRNADYANLAVNGLLALGYVPTYFRLLTSESNPESVTTWIVFWMAIWFAVYASNDGKDFLAKVYAYRALVLVSIVLVLIARLELRWLYVRRNVWFCRTFCF